MTAIRGREGNYTRNKPNSLHDTDWKYYANMRELKKKCVF